jgi:hypothetical protein
MNPQASVTAELFFMDVHPVRLLELMPSQRLDQLGTGYGMVNGIKTIVLLNLNHATVACRDQITTEGLQRGFRVLLFQLWDQSAHLLNQCGRFGCIKALHGGSINKPWRFSRLHLCSSPRWPSALSLLALA